MSYKAPEKTTDESTPSERPHDRLMPHLRNFFNSSEIKWPLEVPRTLDAACGWFIKLAAPAKRSEKPRKVPLSGVTNGVRWEYPYHTRLMMVCDRYFAATEDHRNFIQAAREDGVFWYGEDLPHFSKVYEETMKYNEMKEDEKKAYARACIKQMRAFIANAGA